MKRAFAFLLALAMILSLAVTAFAAGETGSITITNATVGKEYKAYKIFDATIKFKTDANGDQVLENGKPVADGVAYTIEPGSQFFEVLFKEEEVNGVKTYVNTEVNKFFSYNPNTKNVSKIEGVNDSELTKFLNDLVNNGSFNNEGDSITATSDEVKFDTLPYGYYVITSTLGSTVTINSNTPDVSVIDKNQEPGGDFKKEVQVGVDEEGKPIWDTQNTANIGDQITYMISFEATNYDGDKLVKYYQIHDEKGDALWAEFDSFTVKINGKELPRGYYLNQGGDNTDGWEYLNMDSTAEDGWKSIPEAERDWNDAQWYLVHLGEDQFRVTIPWLSKLELIDNKDDQGNHLSYSLSFGEGATSLYDSPAKVEITYDATLEPSAAIGGTTHGNRYNKANASWTSENETGFTPPQEVVTKVYGIGLLKDDTATGQNLAGAKFRIFRSYDALTQVYSDEVWVIPTNINGVYIVDSLDSFAEDMSGDKKELARDMYKDYLEDYLKDEKGNTIAQDNLVISQKNGKLAILGLEAGTYYLKEVEAPEGYNALTTPIEIKAGEGNRSFNIFVNEETGEVADIQQTDGIHMEKIYDLTHTVVHNSKGTELPATGGEGAFMLISIGTMIAIGFAVLMITQKKMSIYKD